MFDYTILDVAIGLIFTYLFFSLVCSAIKEWIAGILSLRSKMLAKGIKSLLQDQTGEGLAKDLYTHGLIEGISKQSQISDKALIGKMGPSYIPKRTFAIALLDNLGMFLPPNSSEENYKRVEEQLELINSANIHIKLKQCLISLIKEANGDIVKLQKNIEIWFDEGMDRVSGWYKRQSQIILLIIGGFITVSMNIDTIYIAQTLYHSPTARVALVAQAQKISGQNLPNKNIDELFSELKNSSLPLGWPQKDSLCDVFNNIKLTQIVGWLLSTMAISMGSPFWFDVLNKFIRIRSTGISPAEKKKEESGQTSAA